MNKKISRKKLLIDVLSIQTASGNEFDMIAYIHKFCQENVPEAKAVIKDNNIYVTNYLRFYLTYIYRDTISGAFFYKRL